MKKQKKVKIKLFLAILHVLARTDNFKILEILICTELNINPLNKNNETPLVK